MDYYKLLGINVGASNEEIITAYRKLAKIWHPDKNSTKEAKETFIALNEAVTVLTNADSRATYDRRLNQSGIQEAIDSRKRKLARDYKVNEQKVVRETAIRKKASSHLFDEAKIRQEWAQYSEAKADPILPRMLSVVWSLPSEAKFTKEQLRNSFGHLGNIKDIMIRERNRKGTGLITFTSTTSDQLPTIDGLEINWITTRPIVPPNDFVKMNSGVDAMDTDGLQQQTRDSACSSV